MWEATLSFTSIIILIIKSSIKIEVKFIAV